MTDPFAAFRPFLEASELVLALDLGRDAVVRAANPTATVRLHCDSRTLVGSPFTRLIDEPDRYAASALLLGSRRSANLHFLDGDGRPFPLAVHALCHPNGVLVLAEPPVYPYLTVADDLMVHANAAAVAERERTRRARRTARQLAELVDGFWHLPRDQARLPVCPGCGRVHSDGHGWESAGDFLARTADFLVEQCCDACAASPSDPAQARQL